MYLKELCVTTQPSIACVDRATARRLSSILLMMPVLFLPAETRAAKSKANAAGRTYYVSITGSNAASGTSPGSPFFTIQRAADAMSPGDTCVIGAGTYRETIIPAHSGLPGRPITFKPAKGASVTISGMERALAWRPYQGAVYQTPLAWTLGPENQVLIVRGNTVTPLQEARWPKAPDDTLTTAHSAMAYATGGSGSTLTDPKIKQTASSCIGSTIWCRGGTGGWLVQTSVVRKYDPSTHTLTFDPVPDTSSPVVPGAGTQYFLTGSIGLLTQDREWVIDPEDHRLFLQSPGGATPANIEVKKRITGIDLSGKSYITVSGLRLLGCNLRMANANHCTIDKVNASYIYNSTRSIGYQDDAQFGNGITISGSDNIISNCSLTHCSGTALNINGNRNTIVNNEIRDVNRCGGYSAPIFLGGGAANVVAHNTLHDTGRYGILVHTGNAEIAYNSIYDYDWLTKDSGAIYCWGVDLQNSHIHHNVIHDGRAYENDAGIYLDNFTENAIVDHNLVYGIDRAGIRFNTPGQYRLLYNNTVAGCVVSFDHWGESPYGEELYGTRTLNNIFTSRADQTPDMMAAHNLESSPGLSFVDAAHGDYHLASNSAGRQAGSAVPGITSPKSKDTPDCGAFEGPVWKAGCDLSHPVSLQNLPSTKAAIVSVPGLNILFNGGFEAGWNGWSAEDKSAVSVIPVPDTKLMKRGKNSKLKLGPAQAALSQNVTGLTPGAPYRLSGWVYVDRGETALIQVTFPNGESKRIAVTDTQYVQATLHFTGSPKPSSVTVSISKTSDGPGCIYADDFGLVKLMGDEPDNNAMAIAGDSTP